MKLKLNDVELFYKKTGHGQPLLMLHGNGEDHRIFDPLASLMSQHYTIYQLDSRNHGQSSQTSDYHYETMAKDVADFITELQLQNVNLLGFSDGAIMTVLLKAYPQLSLRKLALLGINLTPQDLKPEIYQSIVTEYEETKSPLMKLMLEEPNIQVAELTEINTPTLVVAGEDDLCSVDYFKKVTHALPQGELLILTGQDHGSYIIDNTMLAPYLLEFLAD